MVGVGHQCRQGSGDDGHDGHDEDGEQILADAVLGLAVEGFDVEGGLLVAILEFHRPSAEVQFDDGGGGKAGLVRQVGEQHGDLSVGVGHADGAQGDG